MGRGLARQRQEIAQARRRGDRNPKTLVPTSPAELGPVGEARENLVSHRHGGDELPSVDRRGASECQQGTEAVARVAARIAVVEIEIADHRGVDERGRLERRLPAVTEDGARALARGLAGGKPQPDPGGLAVGRAERAAERIDQPLRGGMYGILRQVLESRRAGVFGDLSRDSVHDPAFSRRPALA